MDDDERDYDLVRETIDARREMAKARRRANAWDEPPDFYDDDKEDAA